MLEKNYINNCLEQKNDWWQSLMLCCKSRKEKRKKINPFLLIFMMPILFSACKIVEFEFKNEYKDYKYLKKYVNKKFNKLNGVLVKHNLTSCRRYRSAYSIEGMEYLYSDSIKITVIFDRKYFIGKDSINLIDCNNINSKINICVQSITINNLKSKGTTSFFSRH